MWEADCLSLCGSGLKVVFGVGVVFEENVVVFVFNFLELLLFKFHPPLHHPLPPLHSSRPPSSSSSLADHPLHLTRLVAISEDLVK